MVSEKVVSSVITKYAAIAVVLGISVASIVFAQYQLTHEQDQPNSYVHQLDNTGEVLVLEILPESVIEAAPALATVPEPQPPIRAPTIQPAQSQPPVSDIVTSAGVEQWRELVISIFPTNTVNAVLGIMNCESGGNPNVTGGVGERGLMQIHPLHFDSTYDPTGNLLAAYRISGGGYSWGAWANCRQRLGL